MSKYFNEEEVTVVKICDVIGESRFNENLNCAIDRLREAKRVLNVLQQVAQKEKDPNPVIDAFIERQQREYSFGRGYVLGMLKANYDAAPMEKCSRMVWNEQPLDLALKLEINSSVTEVRKALHASDMTGATEYHERYRRLCELICGYGYNMYFLEDRFKEFYPGTSSCVVEGFADGYASAMTIFASSINFEMDITLAKEQDIWKNYPYFLDPVATEYSLEGDYLFMYHGGCNCSDDPTLPYGNNKKTVNVGLYKALQARDPKSLTMVNIEI